MNIKGSAVVTGGAVRVGKALCLALAAQGYHVVIHYRSSADDAIALEAEIKALGGTASTVQADLTNRTEVAGIIDQAKALAGPVCLLVNSASAFEDDSPQNFSNKSWDLHMELHLHAPMKLAQGFAAQADAVFDNQIINIIDQRVWALTPKFFSYTLSKSALWTATRTLAQALGPQNIRVNAIGPGPTLRNKRQSEADFSRQKDSTILRRGSSPDDITAAVLYLIGAKAVTGQMIAVDGGQHLAWETPDVLVGE